MKIKSGEVQQTVEWVEINVCIGKKEFNISVQRVDGEVIGTYKGMHTSYLQYFDIYSDLARKRHFEKIKRYINDQL